MLFIIYNLKRKLIEFVYDKLKKEIILLLI